MKRISLTYLVPLVLVLSCSGKDESALVPFTLSAGVEPEAAETRAGTDINTRVFELGDTFDVIFGSGVSVHNTTYTVNSSGGTDCFVSSPDEPGISTESADITDAYYPSGVTSNPGVQRNQSTKAGYKASDYMYGKGKINGGTEPMKNVTINGQSNITLQPSQGRIVFRHMNAKVVVNAAARSDIKIRKIFLAPHDMFTGESEPGVIMYNNSVGESIVHSAALLPAASSPGTRYTGTFLRIDTNKGSINYALSSSGKYLISGYVYTLNIDVAQLNTTVGITDWSNAMQPVGDAIWE